MKHLTEALSGSDKSIETMLKFFAASTSGVQKAMYEQKSKDATSVTIEPLSSVLTNDEIQLVKRQRLKPKECYRNAFVSLEALEFKHDVKYVEGFLNLKGLPIEHAYCLIDDHYVDPTIELVLGENPTKDTYVVLKEFTLQEVRKVISETGYWGGIYEYNFLKKYKESV